MTRFHPALVALHWLLAILIVLALVLGGTVLAEIPNDAPEKLTALQAHMIIGITILVLTLIRIGVRFTAADPAELKGEKPLQKKASAAIHGLLYLGVLVMATSGLGLAYLAGLPDIVFGGSGAAVPADFAEFTPRLVHGLVSKLLMALIALHLLAALYHQFIVKDGLLRRMWFGNRQG